MNTFKSITEHIKTINTGIIIASMMLILLGLIVMFTPLTLLGAEETQTGISSKTSESWAFLAAGLSISVSVIGAGIALSRIGSSAMAAIAEKPEIMGSAIVFAGLAEGLSIWGLIVAVLILGKI